MQLRFNTQTPKSLSTSCFICTTHISWFHNVLVNLINKIQQEIHGLLGKKSEFHGIKLLGEEGDNECISKITITWIWPNYLLDLCCSVLQLLSLSFAEKRLCRSVRWHSMCFRKEAKQAYLEPNRTSAMELFAKIANSF